MNEVLSLFPSPFFSQQTEFTVQLLPGINITSCLSKGVIGSQCPGRVAIQTLPRQASSLVDV